MACFHDELCNKGRFHPQHCINMTTMTVLLKLAIDSQRDSCELLLLKWRDLNLAIHLKCI